MTVHTVLLPVRAIATRLAHVGVARDDARAANVALGVTVVTLAISYGVWYAYSVLLVAFIAEFGWSRSVLAGAFAVFTLVNGAWNPLVGWIADRWGPRRVVAAGGVVLALSLAADSLIAEPWHLYVLFGVFTAVGVSTAGWTPAVVLVQRHFRDRLGLALGIAGSGIGLGIFLVVPLVQAVIDDFGWRWAFRGLALLSLAWIVPATWLALRDPSPRVRRVPPAARGDAGRSLTLGAAVLTAPFWLISGAKFFGSVAAQALLVHQAAYLVDHGATPMVAAAAISVVGLASIVGKTGGGWLSDYIEREVVYLVGVGLLVAGLVVLRLAGVLPAWSAYAYAVLFGLGYSVTAALVPAIFSDRFRGAHFGAIFGVGQVASALGCALGAWAAGALFDATGSYALALSLAAAMAAAAAAAIWRARALRISAARSGS